MELLELFNTIVKWFKELLNFLSKTNIKIDKQDLANLDSIFAFLSPESVRVGTLMLEHRVYVDEFFAGLHNYKIYVKDKDYIFVLKGTEIKMKKVELDKSVDGMMEFSNLIECNFKKRPLTIDNLKNILPKEAFSCADNKLNYFRLALRLKDNDNRFREKLYLAVDFDDIAPVFIHA